MSSLRDFAGKTNILIISGLGILDLDHGMSKMQLRGGHHSKQILPGPPNKGQNKGLKVRPEAPYIPNCHYIRPEYSLGRTSQTCEQKTRCSLVNLGSKCLKLKSP